jgi:hypothetical protein
VISFVLSGTRSCVTVTPVPVIAASRCAAGVSAWPGATGALAIHGGRVRPCRIGAQQVGQAAGTGAVGQATDGRRARREAYAEHPDGAGTEPGEGILRSVPRPPADRCERARAPATTAEQATSNTATNG